MISHSPVVVHCWWVGPLVPAEGTVWDCCMGPETERAEKRGLVVEVGEEVVVVGFEIVAHSSLLH